MSITCPTKRGACISPHRSVPKSRSTNSKSVSDNNHLRSFDALAATTDSETLDARFTVLLAVCLGHHAERQQSFVRSSEAFRPETKEIIGGWAILEAESKDEAVRFAKEFMELRRRHWPEFEGGSEVRPTLDPGLGRR